MRTWTTKNDQRVDQVLFGRSNAFLVSNSEGHILVDSGRGGSWDRLTQSIDRFVSDGSRLKALILTHCHFDHAENAAAVKERYGAQIVVHRSETKYLLNGENPPIHGTAAWNRLIVRLLSQYILSRSRYRSAAYDTLAGNRLDLTDWGFNGYILHTPGHSPGSLSVIIDDEIAIVGDAMFGVFRGSVLPPFALDLGLMTESWKRLLDTGCSIFLPAHGTKRGREVLQRQYDKYRSKRRT